MNQVVSEEGRDGKLARLDILPALDSADVRNWPPVRANCATELRDMPHIIVLVSDAKMQLDNPVIYFIKLHFY